MRVKVLPKYLSKALVALVLISADLSFAQELFYEYHASQEDYFLDRASGEKSSPFIFSVEGISGQVSAPLTWKLEYLSDFQAATTLVDSADVRSCCAANAYTHFTPLQANTESIWFLKKEPHQKRAHRWTYLSEISLKKWSKREGLSTLKTISANMVQTKTVRQVRFQEREFVLDYGNLIETSGDTVAVFKNDFPLDWTWADGVPFVTKMFELDGRLFLELTSASFDSSPGPQYRGPRHFGLVELRERALQMVHKHQLVQGNRGSILPLGQSIFIATDLEMPGSGMRRPAILKYSLTTNEIDTLAVKTLPEVDGQLIADPSIFLGKSNGNLYFDLDDTKYRATENSFESLNDNQLPSRFDDTPRSGLFTEFYGDWKYAYFNNGIDRRNTITDLIREDRNGNQELVARDEIAGGPVSDFDRPIISGDAVYFVRGTEQLGFELWNIKGDKIENVFDLAPGSASSNPIPAQMDDEAKFYFVASSNSVRNLWVFDPFVSPVHNENNLPVKHGFDIQVYPNPVPNGKSFRINSDLPLEKVTVFDMMGRLVESAEVFLGRGIEIGVEGLGAGVYLVKVRSGNGLEISEKIVVQ